MSQNERLNIGESISEATGTDATIFTGDAVSFVTFDELRVIRLSKKSRAGDPAGMLDAILTADAPKTANEAVYALLLNAKGRILTDLTVLREDDDLLLVLREAGLSAALEALGRYAPFSRVEVAETELTVTGIFGGDPSSVLPEAPEPGGAAPAGIGGEESLLYAASTGVFVVSKTDPTEALEASGAIPATENEYETARIHASVPLFGRDITPENFPAEAYLEKSAVDFTKGCYPGQETVARMHYRGQPNKYLHRFAVEGDEVEAGTAILQDGKTAGNITSVAPLEVAGKRYALGYLKRRTDANGELLCGDSKIIVSVANQLGDQT